jgi:predicted component of type VI protein secretion system
MAKLILSLDGTVIREVPLDRERVTIGRKPHNDIQIENLAVSGEHARVVTILNDSFLEDLDSTNGTLVNGNPVKKHILQPNDVIEIGKYRLKYVAEAPGPGAAAEDLEKTMVVRPAARAAARPAPEAPPAVPPAAPVAAAPAATAPPAAIRILNGPGAGKELEFTKNMTTLGKPGVQVAVIMRRPQGYFIAHVEGASFPVVNGAALGAQPRALSDHDMIELAGVKMEFFLK